MAEHVLWRRLGAEFIGSAFLAAVVIGSGIAAQRLSPGDVGLELFENAAATAAGLFVIILTVGPISGAHLNPVVSFVDASFGGLRWRHAAAYLPAQLSGCIGGAVVANLMFSVGAISISTKHRASGAHFLSEIVATLGLLLVIFGLARTRRIHLAPAAVGAYIGAAYFFTSSASFANPAITIGRMFSNTFAGIAPSSAPSFIGAQVVGGLAGFLLVKTLYPRVSPAEAAEVVVPHDGLDASSEESSASDGARSRIGPMRPVRAPRAEPDQRSLPCTLSPLAVVTPGSVRPCGRGSSRRARLQGGDRGEPPDADQPARLRWAVPGTQSKAAPRPGVTSSPQRAAHQERLRDSDREPIDERMGKMINSELIPASHQREMEHAVRHLQRRFHGVFGRETIASLPVDS